MAAARAGSRRGGFSLIELMVAIAVVGILASVALPLYQTQLHKGRRSDALVTLMDASNRQEQYMLDHSEYASDMTKLGFAANPAISENGYYQISVTASDDKRSFSMEATPLTGSPQAQDSDCAKMTLTSGGTRVGYDSSDTLNSKCW